MNKFLLLIVLPGWLMFLLSCKEKKVSLSGNDEKVDAHSFVAAFPPLKLPYEVTDTVFRRKEPETSVINSKMFTRILPDSVLIKYFGTALKPHLYAIGRVSVPDNETYIFVKAVTSNRKVLYVLCFDKKKKFVTARPMLYSDNEPGVTGIASMDTKYTLTLTHQHKGPDGQLLFKKDAYIFNEDAGFMLIMTESNEAKTKIPAVYDPLDTLPHKHKFTGDYVQDKRNFITVRDGKDATRFLFFVHFEKDDGACKGELKGEAKFISPTTARYHSNNDPCTIEFTFHTGGGVDMKEMEGCGVHRDIRCSFDGYYDRRAEPRSKARSKPSTKKTVAGE